MPSNRFILCHPLLLLHSIFPSVRVFSNESALRIRWLKYWSFSISPSDEDSGLISFRMDWFYLLVNQGTLKSLLQPHSSKASILRRPASFMAQRARLHAASGDSCHTRMCPREESQLCLEALKSCISFPFSFTCLSKLLFHHVQVRLFHCFFLLFY